MTERTPAVRASDGEREQTVAVLRAHVVDGRLTLEEFAERVDAVYEAKTRPELDALTHDLPDGSPESGPLRRRRPKRFTGVAFGSVERRGRWRVPRVAGLAVLFGDADIDLRTAEIGGGTVTITALILFGNADFYVPRSVDVDLGGFTMFGHRREHGDDADAAPQATARSDSRLLPLRDERRVADSAGNVRYLSRADPVDPKARAARPRMTPR